MPSRRSFLLTMMIPVALAGLISACLPNPQSVKERRDSFDRGGLLGSLILKEAPSDMTAVGAIYADRIKLLGYTLDPAQPRRGDSVTVTFFWTPLRAVDEEYQVFMHGDAVGGGARRIHGDHFPAKGKYPTDVWQVGEVIADPFRISIDSQYGPKQIGLHTGLYKDNYRVPLTDAGKAPKDGQNRSQAVTISLP